ncbi:MAG: DUF2612 domain-containing protein, partial [Deltaproteobacteria bacterium]
MSYTVITTHVPDAVAKLTSAYSERPKATGLVMALAQEVQAIEDAIDQANQARLLFGNKAVGAQLDALGELIGLKRNGLDDPTYLALLYGTIAENNADGTTEALI